MPSQRSYRIRDTEHSLGCIPKASGFRNASSLALVAQGIERLVAVQKVAGSIPAERTKTRHPGKGFS